MIKGFFAWYIINVAVKRGSSHSHPRWDLAKFVRKRRYPNVMCIAMYMYIRIALPHGKGAKTYPLVHKESILRRLVHCLKPHLVCPLMYQSAQKNRKLQLCTKKLFVNKICIICAKKMLGCVVRREVKKKRNLIDERKTQHVSASAFGLDRVPLLLLTDRTKCT